MHDRPGTTKGTPRMDRDDNDDGELTEAPPPLSVADAAMTYCRVIALANGLTQ